MKIFRLTVAEIFVDGLEFIIDIAIKHIPEKKKKLFIHLWPHLLTSHMSHIAKLIINVVPEYSPESYIKQIVDDIIPSDEFENNII